MGKWVVAAWFVVLSVLSAQAWADKRVALVIGVADYRTGGKLVRTLSDAHKIRAALTEVGFTGPPVIENPTKAILEQALLDFNVRAQGAEVAVLYFSGHGIQHDNDNWLIPVEAALRAPEHAPFESIRLRDVVEVMRPARLRIVFLDTCSENRFESDWGRTKSQSGGLAPVTEQSLPFGTLVSYAAASGEKSPDDGLYADALAKWIRVEGLELKQLLGRVREEVRQKNPKANPEFRSRYDGEFSFKTTAIVSQDAAAAFLAAKDGKPTAQREFRDCESCPTLVALPARQDGFSMGSPDDEAGREATEGPQRRIVIDFQIAVGKFEITWAEYKRCVAAGACGKMFPPDEFPDAYPVAYVSWNNAQEYVAWLSLQTARTYRLLSEAEWEYAARGNTTTAYWWGTSASRDFANYGKDTCCDGYAIGADRWVQASPVGSFRANAFGLHDTQGNVDEWVEDCYVPNFSIGQPTNGQAFDRCSTTEMVRVFRGGSWHSTPDHVRSASRGSPPTGGRLGAPSVMVSPALGFRIARESK